MTNNETLSPELVTMLIELHHDLHLPDDAWAAMTQFEVIDEDDDIAEARSGSIEVILDDMICFYYDNARPIDEAVARTCNLVYRHLA